MESHLLVISILEYGDIVYKNLGRFGLLSVDDLPSEISITDVCL